MNWQPEDEELAIDAQARRNARQKGEPTQTPEPTLEERVARLEGFMCIIEVALCDAVLGLHFKERGIQNE